MSVAFRLGKEVRDAVAGGRAVVALETSVIGQGLPVPRNAECIERMGEAIRSAGAVPAWIGVVHRSVTVGMARDQLQMFVEPGVATKVARRDLPAAVAAGLPGATTVSATIWAAARAGIGVSATGGIGGVHPGEDPDVSADLLELARTPGLLVCSGPKSIVDPARTAERLEELGVLLIGLAVDRLPHFLAREAPIELEHRVESTAQAAELAGARADLRTESTVVLCNPIPADAAMDPAEVAAAAQEAEVRADRDGIRGKARTPYLLAAMAELTGGRSLDANLALLEANARVAAEVAVALVTGARSG
jgi:pseudouridine-5'-phosphate glycosidase